MRELKLHLMLNKEMHWMPVYLKVEADEVIAELKKACKDKDDWCLHLIKERHHHKYKRCLAMAKWCNERHTFNETNEKRTWLHKWHKRWLKIAEKFKEAK